MALRILFTDLFFPNNLAKWRLVEIKAFIEKYDTDILVYNRLDKWNSVSFNVDYQELLESHSLDRYDILIFNKRYNYLNEYNDTEFDGTQFNGSNSFDYLLRLKKYRDEKLNFHQYDAVYHLFLHMYLPFNRVIGGFPHSKQFVHLYPGGGLNNAGSLSTLRPEVGLIISNHYITEFAESINLKNKYIEVFGGPYLNKDEIIKAKIKNVGTLNVCFTTLGSCIHKGGHIYQQIIKNYLQKYPNDDIKFYCIGLNHNIAGAEYLGLMSQEKLDSVYQNQMDILFNLEIGVALNGCPLGIEAMVNGMMLFTTDHHNGNVNNKYNFGKELRIIDHRNMDDILDKLKELYDDREMLLKDSNLLQLKATKLFDHENIMVPIFNFIENY